MGACRGGSLIHDFQEKLAFSKGVRQATDLETIRAWIDGCVDVRVTNVRQDKCGVDYVAVLSTGVEILIDGKTRTPGCSKWWKGEPEFPMERWSVMPGGRHKMPECRARVGWALDQGKQTNLVYFSFDPSDADAVYLVSFHLLRMAFTKNRDAWMEKYPVCPQDSGTWQSLCCFVPASVVQAAINQVSVGSASKLLAEAKRRRQQTAREKLLTLVG